MYLFIARLLNVVLLSENFVKEILVSRKYFLCPFQSAEIKESRESFSDNLSVFMNGTCIHLY